MRKQNKKWNIDSIKAAAVAYDDISNFRKNSPKAHAAARRLKILKDVTAHMIETQEQWNHENVAKTAAQYKTRGEFSKAAAGGYTFARRKGILDEICAHMPSNVSKANAKWTKSTIMAEAAKFPTKSKFRTGNRSAYVTASKMGILAELFGDLK